ncbi:uptake hydrogenase small subunit [Desulfuribacillus stibiiarsenatis]|uniref:Uptake hydrogenase small subunit n=1 Tax=Desulfuribacillus stibiiarsenatis TaxID=1390249 RepID=A0A1E5L3W3_9FIRM|nr:hydrogenase small subunit [Desulfuribacillus stibiiarsenatis]OEH84629.1 uptake hydrogenase small subunit [Desulfuribacillus stibiiarsenatis]
MPNTYYDILTKRGYTREEFLKFCTTVSVMLGLEASSVPKIANALETQPRLPVIYLNLQECTCCMESFIRTAHPLLEDLLFNMISLDYSETLSVASGHAVEEARKATMRDYKNNYLVIVEGSIPVADDGIYTTIGGQSAQQILEETVADSIAVIAYGSCATNTCVQGAYPNPTGARRVREIVKNKPVIDVPGCPPIAEVITGTIVHYLTFGKIPELTNLGRPKAFYNQRIHDNCSRRSFFDAGMFVEKFDDEGHKHGWCLYKVGCKGPTTYNACAITQWNNGVSWPVKSGHPCLGCSEDNWYNDATPFYERRAIVPGMAVPHNANDVGKIVTGVTAAGVATHALATAIIKGKEKDELNHKNNTNPENKK